MSKDSNVKLKAVMPPPRVPGRMTANPVKAPRHRPGKVTAEQASSSSEEQDDEDEEVGTEQTSKLQAPRPPPKATSFPSGKAPTSNLKNLDLDARRREDRAKEQARKDAERLELEKMERDAGFVTESEEDDSDEQDNARSGKAQARPARRRGSASEDQSSGEEESSGSEEDDSEEEDSSDSDSSAGKPKMLRPMFIKKSDRSKSSNAQDTTARDLEAEEEVRAQAEADRKKQESNALIQAQIDAEAAMREARSREWDDEGTGELDDTDGLDPELEHAQWVARELSRLKRARAALEEREAELAEVERRRNLSTPEREAEDKAKIAEQQDAKEGKGKAGFMARYHHRGAFFGDAEDEQGRKLAERDLMGAQFEGESAIAKEALPKYLQVRDQTMIGRKGRQRHRDLRSDDTGQWGDFGKDGGFRKRRDDGDGPFVSDERFRPDRPGDVRGATGANATSVGNIKKRAYGHERDEVSKRTKRVEAG